MIEATNLTKKFDDILAVDHINAQIREGSVFGLITEQILRSRADTAQDGNLLFHALGKGIDLAVFLKSEAL